MTIELYHGDCLEILPTLEAGSVDAVITDLPYGTTQCKWDSIIPFTALWKQMRRLLAPHSVFVTTASQPFTSALIMSNLDWFSHCVVWEKQHPKGFYNARRQPLRSHEDIVVFSDGAPVYHPQGLTTVNIKSSRRNKGGSGVYGSMSDAEYIQAEGNFPRSVWRFDAITHGAVHSTQKPIALYEYLIRTYANENDVVLDFVMGSGTTGVACVQTGRSFIGIEIDQGYFSIAKKRIEEAQAQLRLPFVDRLVMTQPELVLDGEAGE